MPKPGPKSYECMKKAWHSDTHHQIRAKTVQNIYRIAIEIHKPETVQNPQWKNELSKVVSKVEEILYSNAKSRDEYLREDNLKQRMYEAVDVIIGRTKEGDQSIPGIKMLPCVEAALTLTCQPASKLPPPKPSLFSGTPLKTEDSAFQNFPVGASKNHSREAQALDSCPEASTFLKSMRLDLNLSQNLVKKDPNSISRLGMDEFSGMETRHGSGTASGLVQNMRLGPDSTSGPGLQIGPAPGSGYFFHQGPVSGLTTTLGSSSGSKPNFSTESSSTLGWKTTGSGLESRFGFFEAHDLSAFNKFLASHRGSDRTDGPSSSGS